MRGGDQAVQVHVEEARGQLLHRPGQAPGALRLLELRGERGEDRGSSGQGPDAPGQRAFLRADRRVQQLLELPAPLPEALAELVAERVADLELASVEVTRAGDLVEPG